MLIMVHRFKDVEARPESAALQAEVKCEKCNTEVLNSATLTKTKSWTPALITVFATRSLRFHNDKVTLGSCA